jgi:hypothetical protein
LGSDLSGSAYQQLSRQKVKSSTTDPAELIAQLIGVRVASIISTFSVEPSVKMAFFAIAMANQIG